ncbi:hypothetical protein H9L05_07935 [Hymenobacter qilianensis]|uniref:Uncharacterized protein n=1 Tax=Hymenobacter qilianensis TaxID=1385715 RepID=A0A7H0GYX6_9BACT|nr:hypothetical protein [Hymenobacter qilianensis]QNP53492.1 hypothetical protein H9L05_07935 [Hymenobacter qilianensis]
MRFSTHENLSTHQLLFLRRAGGPCHHSPALHPHLPARARYAPSTYKNIISDLFIRNKVEYLRLQDGFELRLDALVAVDDKELRNYC